MASDAYVAVRADNGVTRSSLATSMAFFESWVEFVKKSHKNQPINLDNSLLSFFDSRPLLKLKKGFKI